MERHCCFSDVGGDNLGWLVDGNSNHGFIEIVESNRGCVISRKKYIYYHLTMERPNARAQESVK